MKFNVVAGAEERAAAQEFNMEAEANRATSAATTHAAPPSPMLSGSSLTGGMSTKTIFIALAVVAVAFYMVKR